jgi:hypothetical protein
MQDAQKLREAIAKAIKTADSSYFFENYTKQATAVLKALEREGFALLPVTPDEKMIKIGLDNIPSGRVKPDKLVANIYTAMVKSAI